MQGAKLLRVGFELGVSVLNGFNHSIITMSWGLISLIPWGFSQVSLRRLLSETVVLAGRRVTNRLSARRMRQKRLEEREQIAAEVRPQLLRLSCMQGAKKPHPPRHTRALPQCGASVPMHKGCGTPASLLTSCSHARMPLCRDFGRKPWCNSVGWCSDQQGCRHTKRRFRCACFIVGRRRASCM